MRGLCVLVAVFVLGCGGRDTYRCASSDQCVGNGAMGVCEPNGFCSFADSTCPGGRRFEDNAGGGLGGKCAMVDAGIDAMTVDQCIGDVTFGRHYGCMLKKDGTVWCAGANQRGQIGFGLAGASNVLDWMQARDATTGTVIADATAIGGGWEHVCVVRAGGGLWCWGRNDTGQVGNNTIVDAPAAVRVLRETDNMPLTGIVEVGAGLDYTCARDMAGVVYCFGKNNNNQIGDNTTMQRNRAVQVTTGALAISVGREGTCVSKAGDELWCWGRNQSGLFGDGTSAPKPMPTMIGTAKQFEVGTFAMCRINTDDTVSCSGNGWRYRIGNGMTNSDGNAITPVQVLDGSPTAPAIANVVEVVAGGGSCARLASGIVKCWGDNTHGMSGVGAASPYPKTVRLANGAFLDDAEKLWASFSHLCARRKSGEIVCWGRGLSGEFGDRKLEDRGAAAPLVFPCP